jgi:crotonobetainyl-CoA:carnitine CoA-transferase CaiB-like acyl-CoA transferase
MTEALRSQAGSRGIIPFDVPGIGIYECSDGHVFGYVGAPGGARWSDLLAWMDEENMAEGLTEEPYKEFIDHLDLRFLTSFTEDPATISQKIQMMTHIAGILRKFTATKTKWEMYMQGQERRLLWGIVSTPKDLAENPQLMARKWLTPVEHPELDATLDYPGTPYRLSETPWAIHARPPLVGEHNQQIFGEELGVSESEWQKLESQGAV